MRTRRTTALSDDKPEGEVTIVPNGKDAIQIDSKADRSSSGHPSDAGATGDKEDQKAAKAVKRRKGDAEKTKKIGTVSLTGRKRHNSDTVEQQVEKAKGPAAFRKQKRSSIVAQEEQATSEGIQELKGAAQNDQTAMQQSAKIGGMLAAMTNDAMETPEENDDDDEAPEEVSMAAGKAGAAQQRQQEREAAAQKRAAARARAEKRAAVAAEQKADREAQQAAKGKEGASQRPVSTGDKPEQDEEDDLLPPEVLDAVIKQSREAERNQHSKAAALSKGAQPEADPGSRQAKKRPKWDPAQPRKVGPVYVQILDQLPPPSASASAKAFAQERILGGSHKRSAEMLLPTRKQLPSHGPPSAYSGRALKPVQ